MLQLLTILFGLGKKSPTPLSDEELVALYKNTGNNIHIGTLYKRYTHLVLGVCMKYLKDAEAANDAAMEIFEKLLIDLKRHDVQQFKPWLFTLSRNHCLMKLRKQKTEAGRLDGYEYFLQDIMEEDASMHLLYEGDEKELLLEKLTLAIEQLKEEQKQCIRLFYFEERSYKEIEEMTGLDDKQVKSYLQNGKRNLKLMLTGNG